VKPSTVSSTISATEADAAAAHDAAFVVEPDARPDIDVLRLLDLLFTKPGNPGAMLHAELLKAALARLVANRAIQRVIDQEELHHALPADPRQIALRADPHVVRDRVGTSDDWTRHPLDDRFAVGVEWCFFTRLRLGHPHLDQAHTAITRRRELRVIAIVWDLATCLTASLDHSSSLRKLMPLSVDLNVEQGNCRFVCRFD